MQTLSGVWPAGSGSIVETITVNPPVTFRAHAVELATLSCCPRALIVDIDFTGGSQTTFLIGAGEPHYSTSLGGRNSSSSNATKFGVTAIHLRKGGASDLCTGAPYQLKVCMTVVDQYCSSLADIINKNCNPTVASYVDLF